MTSSVPASPELNKINIWLKEHSLGGHLYERLEDYIVRLLFEVPKPFPPYKLKFYLPSKDTISEIPQIVEVKTNSMDFGMPNACNQAIRTLMSHLSLDNIFLLFKRVLLDTSNLFLSQDVSKLIDCCEAIKTLIYPFKYD